jgi:hypothetical protein
MNDSWSSDVECLLDNLQQNCVHLNKFHKRRFFYFKNITIYFKIPTIVISSIASVATFGLGGYLSQSNISGIVCLMSLSVSILNSIELFLKINETTILELETSKAYYQLSASIHKTLKLERNNRKTSGLDCLEKFYRDYSELYESSALIINFYPDKFLHIPKPDKINLSSSASSSSSTNSLNDFEEESPKITNSILNISTL